MNNKNYISARDIAENAKLNHEIVEELRRYKINHQLSSSSLTRGSRSNKDSLATWIPVSGTGITKIIGLLSILTFLPFTAHAETCTATPDCKSLGYTETSCPDGGGVKCPWNPNLMYCCAKKVSCEVKSCQVGDVLFSDKKCYTCLTLPDQVPIGVVFSSGKAVALNDLSAKMMWREAVSACKSYSVGGVSGWYLPSKDELVAMSVYSNRSSIVQGFSNAIGGKDFVSNYYWSSSFYGLNNNGDNVYWVVIPNSGSDYSYWEYEDKYVRPVLAF